MRHLRLLLAPLLLALTCVAACVSPSARAGSPSGLVVSQVYASGGNSGAAYQNDFVELLNTGSAPVDLTG